MSIPTFFAPELTVDSDEVELNEEESRHALAVRRLQPGSSVRLLNGQGLVAVAQIANIQRRSVSLEICAAEMVARPSLSLDVAVAVPKADRQRFMIEGLTQLGVRRIIPLDAERSATASSHKSVSKWQRYALEACKQSQNPWLPEVCVGYAVQALTTPATPATLSTKEFIAAYDTCWLADADGQSELPSLSAAGKHHLLVIGPEGGFTATEKQCFSDNAFRQQRFGAWIMRTEAAAIVCSGVLMLSGAQ